VGSVLGTGTGDFHSFEFHGGPIDDPKSVTAAFAILGHAAMAWARLEAHIDAVLVHINKTGNSKDLYKPGHPIGFSGKLKLLKRWFTKHPPLKQYEPKIRLAFTAFKNLSRSRNLMLHGILEAYDPETKIVKFTSMKFEGNDTFRVGSYAINLDQISQFTETVNQANAMFGRDISSKLFTPDSVEQLKTRE
jgi:hypothetical protein